MVKSRRQDEAVLVPEIKAPAPGFARGGTNEHDVLGDDGDDYEYFQFKSPSKTKRFSSRSSSLVVLARSHKDDDNKALTAREDEWDQVDADLEQEEDTNDHQREDVDQEEETSDLDQEEEAHWEAVRNGKQAALWQSAQGRNVSMDAHGDDYNNGEDWPQAGEDAAAQDIAGPGVNGKLECTVTKPQKENEGTQNQFISYLVSTTVPNIHLTHVSIQY